ncbi:MAG: hypothetical protein ACM3H8_12675 [Sphingobacteriales bacterium]
MNSLPSHPASFKDPAGFIFKVDGIYYRQVNQSYSEEYNLLMSSGLYERLVQQKKLIAHTEIESHKSNEEKWFKTLLPQQLDFISYPYEWCFDQLKDAALLTLQIHKESLKAGMSLKDATPFNIQWLNGKPVFIDTLSFEKYTEGEPWVAYKQFCESFFAPLLLMRYRNQELNKLLISYPNGVPLTIAADLLPAKTKFNLSTYLHIHLQARFQRKAGDGQSTKKNHLGLEQLNNIIESLYSCIKKLELQKQKTTWNNYYEETILSKDYLAAKEQFVKEFISLSDHKTILDLGANTGEFSLLAAQTSERVIAADFDADCINNLYNQTKQNKNKNIFPLVINISNPTPAIGWANKERESFWQRINVDLVMALALVHHLCISGNISFTMLADVFKTKCRYLIIEFVPKADPKVQQLLNYRKDIFEEYTEPNFEKTFSNYFVIIKQETIISTNRILYLMKNKNTNV